MPEIDGRRISFMGADLTFCKSRVKMVTIYLTHRLFLGIRFIMPTEHPEQLDSFLHAVTTSPMSKSRLN